MQNQRVYGLWNGSNSWMIRVDGTVIYDHNPQVMAAFKISTNPGDRWKVREIGTDGWPIETGASEHNMIDRAEAICTCLDCTHLPSEIIRLAQLGRLVEAMPNDL